MKNPPHPTAIIIPKKNEEKLFRLYDLIILHLLGEKKKEKGDIFWYSNQAMITSPFQISDMSDNILDSFRTILSELDWMDKDTREVAEEKVRGLLTSIGI